MNTENVNNKPEEYKQQPIALCLQKEHLEVINLFLDCQLKAMQLNGAIRSQNLTAVIDQQLQPLGISFLNLPKTEDKPAE